MLPEGVMDELAVLRITTLGACKRLRASARRVLLHHCLCTIDNVLPVARDDARNDPLGTDGAYALYRGLWQCRLAIENALNSTPCSRLAFTRSLRDQMLETCREAGLWRKENP